MTRWGLELVAVAALLGACERSEPLVPTRKAELSEERLTWRRCRNDPEARKRFPERCSTLLSQNHATPVTLSGSPASTNPAAKRAEVEPTTPAPTASPQVPATGHDLLTDPDIAITAVASGFVKFFVVSSDNDKRPTSRNFDLDYSIRPIVFAHASLTATLAGGFGIGVGYATDRVYRSGGSVGQTSLTRELGVTGAASDVIDAVLRYSRIQASGSISHFDFGEVRQLDAATGTVVASSPFQVAVRQIDLDYDAIVVFNDLTVCDVSFSKATDPGCKHMDSAMPVAGVSGIGLRYMDYEIPRIVYETEQPDPQTPNTLGAYRRESSPQTVRTPNYMIGFFARSHGTTSALVSPILDLWLYTGISRTTVTMPTSTGGTEDVTIEGSPIDWGLRLGAMLRITDKNSPAKLSVGVAYSVRLVDLSGLGDPKFPGGYEYNFGSLDLFHGPDAQLSVSM